MALEASQEELDYTVQACFPNTKSLLLAVQSIKPSTKQPCEVVFESTGVTIRWQHESKAMQSGILLPVGLWDRLDVTQRVSIGIPFSTLLDTLAVFASTAQQLHLRYPGPNAELLLESTTDEADDATFTGSSTYARISTIDFDDLQELSEYWEEPSSYFIAKGAMLREAIEDLEWTKGHGEITLRRDPQLVTLSSSGNALSLKIELPNDALSAFACSTPLIKHRYSHKHLKTAFANIPIKDHGGVSTKVVVDNRGLMKVTHMLNLALVGKEIQEVTHPLASVETQAQRAAVSRQRYGVAQFQILPLSELVDDDEEEEGGGGVHQFDGY